MRIISSYHRRNTITHVKRIAVGGSSVLITALYCAGLLLGGALYVSVNQIQHFTDNVLMEQFIGSMPLSNLTIIYIVSALSISLAIFGSGLSLAGYPSIYLTPLLSGAFSGVFSLSFFNAHLDMGLVKFLILLPVYCTGMTIILFMCEIAGEMTSYLIRNGSDREVGDTKKYSLRIVLLTLSVILSGIMLSLLIVLLRHFH